MDSERPLKRPQFTPLRDLGEVRILILTYDPATDEVTIDASGVSPIEARGIISQAYNDTFEKEELDNE